MSSPGIAPPPLSTRIARLATLADRAPSIAAAGRLDALRQALALDLLAVRDAATAAPWQVAAADPALADALRAAAEAGAPVLPAAVDLPTITEACGPADARVELLAGRRGGGFPDPDDRALLQLAGSQLLALRAQQPGPAHATRSERARDMLGQLGEAVVGIDAGGRVEFVNAAAARLFGRDPAGCEGHPASGLLTLLDPGSRTPVDSAALAALASGRDVAPPTHRLLVAGDRHHEVDERATPLLDGGGRVTGVVLELRDAGPRLRALARHERLQREAERQRERQARAFQLAPSFMALLRGPEHVFELANERYHQLVGHREIIGRPVREALPEAEGQGIIELLDRVYRSGEPFIARALPVQVGTPRGDGAELRVLDFVYQPLHDADGRATGILVHGVDLTERIRAEAALRERDQRLQLLLDNAADYGVIITDRDGRVLEWLGGSERITGWPADAMVGRSADVIFTEADRAAGQPQREREQACERGRAEDRRWHRRRDGSAFFADGVMVALREAGGDLEGFGKLFRDATARRQAEDELARVRMEAERRRRLFEVVLSNTPDLVYVLDVEHRFIYANEALLRIWGRGWDAAIGRDFHQLGYPAASAEQLDRDTDRVIRDRQPVRGEIAYDGTTGVRHYDYIFAPVIGTDGEVEAIAGTTRDITERKRSEERFALLAAASQRINASLDIDRIVRTAAEQARVIVGAAQASVTLMATGGREGLGPDPVHDGDPAFAGSAAQLARSGLQREVCRRGRPMRLARDELRQHPAWLAMAGGESPPAGWVATPLLAHGGQCLGVIELVGSPTGAFSDEDESVLAQLATVVAIGLENARLYDSLRLADQRKDEFLATLAHELRNPLAPLRYALELIGRAPQPAEREAARQMAARQFAQLVRLVDDLLDVARISLGKLQLRRQPITLQEVVASAVEASRPLIDARGQQLRIELPATPLRVDADPTRLAQVLMNLLNNAAKYSETGTRIDVGGGSDGDFVVLRVRDQGIGIPESMLARIFEPFSQLEPATERSHGGLGIGLTLVRRLVELHGGQVEAHSAGSGRGSEFVVRLPRLDAIEGPSPAPPAAAVGPNRRRVLVVDDNHDAATSLTILLASLGHQVRAAFDGHQALAMAADLHPEVVVLDIGMPGLDGYEVARRMRRMPGVCDAVLIALTGWGQDADRRASRDAGFDHHLVKPANLDELQRLVAGAQPH